MYTNKQDYQYVNFTTDLDAILVLIYDKLSLVHRLQRLFSHPVLRSDTSFLKC